MKFKCSQACKTKNKRIAVIQHCVEEKHTMIVITTNRGYKTTLRAEILKHEEIPNPVNR